MIRDSNPDTRINPDSYPDPDDCRICSKILWMHYLVGVSRRRVCIAQTICRGKMSVPMSVCLSVCPSVRPSVTRRYSVKTAKDFVKLFSPSGSHVILVFPHQTEWQYSDGDPLMGRQMQGVWKNHDFRPISRFISEMMQDKSHGYYGRRIGNCTQAFELYQFDWSWVTSNPDFNVTILFNVN